MLRAKNYLALLKSNDKWCRIRDMGIKVFCCGQLEIAHIRLFNNFGKLSSAKEKLPIGQALGKVSSCWIKKVPPGSPILIPGEAVTNWHLQRLSADTVVQVVEND